MPAITSNREKTLLTRIKHLEEKLKQLQAENNNLKIEQEQAQQLVQAEQERSIQLENKLKATTQVLDQWQQINHYKQQEQEQKAQIEQSPFFKWKR